MLIIWGGFVLGGKDSSVPNTPGDPQQKPCIQLWTSVDLLQISGCLTGTRTARQLSYRETGFPEKLVGGFDSTPLKNHGVRQLGWWHSQYIWKVIIQPCSSHHQPVVKHPALVSSVSSVRVPYIWQRSELPTSQADWRPVGNRYL